MANVSSLPDFFIRVLPDEENEPPTSLTVKEAGVLVSRAARNFNELLTILSEGGLSGDDTTEAPGVEHAVGVEGTAGAGDAGGGPVSMSIEVSWDADERVVPLKAQEALISLVAAGCIMSLRDFLKSMKESDDRA